MMKKLLLHTCCGPCIAYVAETLRKDWDITSYFFNPNIHPYTEYLQRSKALAAYTALASIPLVEESPDASAWFDMLLAQYGSMAALWQRTEKRCGLCYAYRLERTAQYAHAQGYTAFSTTLLYSVYQFHDAIRACGHEIGKKYGIQFVYADFRTGWQQGIQTYKQTGLYRQAYCGCVMSNEERWKK